MSDLQEELETAAVGSAAIEERKFNAQNRDIFSPLLDYIADIRKDRERLTRERDEARAKLDAEQRTSKNLYITLNGALEEKSKLMAERDEARAKLTAAISKPLTTAMEVAISSIHEAEQRGYERGKADAEIAGREVLLPVKREQSLRLMQHAEAQGYRRGVHDAAKVADSRVNYYASLAAAQAVYNCSKAILALLEQTEAGEKK